MHAWHEIVVHGPEGAVRAFVTGFLAGYGPHGEGVVFAHDAGVAPESLTERVRERFHAGSHLVLLAPEPLAGAVLDAIDARGGAAGLAIEHRRPVGGASFAFAAEGFTEARAAELRAALFETLPDGVAIADRVEREERHPEVKGVELYDRLHAYTYRASGRATGSIPGVLEMRRRAAVLDGVTAGAVHVAAGPAA